jgi:HPt (histidine-containing phosphotransfer) domain-containing protein
MKVVYIQRRLSDLAECNKAIESGDFSFIEKVGHQVKGNAQSFGFDILSPIGIEMEAAAKAGHIDSIKKAVLDFGTAVENIKNNEL